MFKYWSPMSVGSWALSLFGLCSFLSFLGSLWPGGRLERILRRSWFARVLQVVGCLVGFFVASYTGALLTATNQPIWSDSVWIAPLFLTSAASTGIALMILLARWRRRLRRRCSVWNGPTCGRWAWSWSCFGDLPGVAGRQPAAGAGELERSAAGRRRAWSACWCRWRFTCAWALSLRGPAVAAAALALFGGCLLRYALVRTPPELLERGPVGGANSARRTAGRAASAAGPTRATTAPRCSRESKVYQRGVSMSDRCGPATWRCCCWRRATCGRGSGPAISRPTAPDWN